MAPIPITEAAGRDHRRAPTVPEPITCVIDHPRRLTEGIRIHLAADHSNLARPGTIVSPASSEAGQDPDQGEQGIGRRPTEETGVRRVVKRPHLDHHDHIAAKGGGHRRHTRRWIAHVGDHIGVRLNSSGWAST